jgi:hypothetical protein
VTDFRGLGRIGQNVILAAGVLPAARMAFQ